MSSPTLVIEVAEPLSPAALREFRALLVGRSSHLAAKWPGFFDVNVPAERLGIEGRREADCRALFPLPLLGNNAADKSSRPWWDSIRSARTGVGSSWST